MTEPSEYQIRAALEVARVVDAAGNPTGDVRDAYRHLLTLGEYTSQSLGDGERLLIGLGLLVEADGRLYPSDALAVLAHVPEAEGLDAIRNWRRTQQDSDLRDRIGAAGEVAVVAACRRELDALGFPELASRVLQLSLVDDTLGYDVSAPALVGPTRHLEVKTTSQATPGAFACYLSRNEYEVGLREPDAWALVACTWGGDDDAEVVGWCRASTLLAYLPTDGNGRWTEARLRIPTARLFPGIPPAA